MVFGLQSLSGEQMREGKASRKGWLEYRAVGSIYVLFKVVLAWVPPEQILGQKFRARSLLGRWSQEVPVKGWGNEMGKVCIVMQVIIMSKWGLILPGNFESQGRAHTSKSSCQGLGTCGFSTSTSSVIDWELLLGVNSPALLAYKV